MRNGLQYIVMLVCIIRYDTSHPSCLQTSLRADLALHTEHNFTFCKQDNTLACYVTVMEFTIQREPN
jgi:hypothetical protein